MAANDNRFIAFWASHKMRARVYGWALLLAVGQMGLAQMNTYRALERSREREVVRIGCDGIPQLVRVDNEVYAEPNDLEIQALSRKFAVKYMRADSYSIVQDVAECMDYMTTELADAYRKVMRGTEEAPGAIAQIEALKRRTQIDVEGLEVKVDKKSYPWRASVKGIRQIVGQAEGQPFELALSFYKSERTLVNPWGLLVTAVKVGGPPLAAPEVKEPRVGG